MNASGKGIGEIPFGSFRITTMGYVPAARGFLISQTMEERPQVMILVAALPIRTFPFLVPKPEPVRMIALPRVPSFTESSG